MVGPKVAAGNNEPIYRLFVPLHTRLCPWDRSISKTRRVGNLGTPYIEYKRIYYINDDRVYICLIPQPPPRSHSNLGKLTADAYWPPMVPEAYPNQRRMAALSPFSFSICASKPGILSTCAFSLAFSLLNSANSLCNPVPIMMLLSISNVSLSTAISKLRVGWS